MDELKRVEFLLFYENADDEVKDLIDAFAQEILRIRKECFDQIPTTNQIYP